MPTTSHTARSGALSAERTTIKASAQASPGRAADQGVFTMMPRLIERLHRRYLDLLRAELARLDVRDLAPVQLLLLLNLDADDLSVQELIDRGNYLRTQAVYNIKKMVENGYVDQARGKTDRRTMRIRPTRKSQQLCEVIRARLTELGTAVARTEDRPDNIDLTYRVLRRLERAWEDHLRYGRI